MFQITYDINYKNNVFAYPELMCIHGEPRTSLILALQNQAKINAQSVHSTIGGGINGHFGLVVDPATYTLVLSTMPCVRPTLLVLILPTG
eukprot:300618-Ditylum_brightwellii.AAC.1